MESTGKLQENDISEKINALKTYLEQNGMSADIQLGEPTRNEYDMNSYARITIKIENLSIRKIIQSIAISIINDELIELMRVSKTGKNMEFSFYACKGMENDFFNKFQEIIRTNIRRRKKSCNKATKTMHPN